MKVAEETKFKACDELNSNSGMNRSRMEKIIFIKFAKTVEMKTRDLNGVKCIKDEDQRVLVKEEA